MKFATILVCLTPSCKATPITEYTFYLAVNPTVSVKNIKIIGRSIPIKAFIQVENKQDAELAIEKLHNKSSSVGKLKIFKSDKSYIALEKTLKQILEETRNSCEDSKKNNEIDCSESHKNKFVNTLTEKKEHKYKNCNAYSSVVKKEANEEPVRDSFNKNGSGLYKNTGPNDISNKFLQEINQGFFKNKIKCNENWSEIIARGAKKILPEQTSIYIKASNLHYGDINELIDLIHFYSEILNAEFETVKEVLFVDFKSKKDAKFVIKSLNNQVYNDAKLTVGLCEDFSHLLDASVSSDYKTQSQQKDDSLSFQERKENSTDNGPWSLHLNQPPFGFEIEDFAVLIGKITIPSYVTESVHRLNDEKIFIAAFETKRTTLHVLSRLQNSNAIGFMKRLELRAL